VSDPRRLIDDPSMPEALRRTLADASRHAPPIDPSGLAKLEGAMRAGSGGLGGAGAAGIAVLLIGAGAWLAWQATEAPATSAVPAPVTAPAPDPVAGPVAAPEPVPDPIPEPVAVPVPPPEPTPVPEPVLEPATAPEPDPGRAGPDPDPDSDLAREMAMLAEARRALESDPARALALAERGRREFPRSLFAEERAAIRILALAAQDRDAQARRLGEAFLAEHPSSPFAARVRRAIEEQ
jgi:hypothetical protein